MDTNIVTTGLTGTAAIATAVLTLVGARGNQRDRRERQADRQEKEATADKLRAEKEEITQRASGLALASVQSELTRVKGDLENAYKEARELREELNQKNDQIDEQDRTIRLITRKSEELQEQNVQQAGVIRRLTRRSETLEEWINSNRERFEELGINGLPHDAMGDRHHHVGPDLEEREQEAREADL